MLTSYRTLVSPKDRVLLFIPVGNHAKTIQLMTGNIDHLRTFEAVVSIDVFLVHYDGDQQSWLEAVGPWYSKNVKFHSEVHGLKMWLAKDLLFGSTSQVQIDSYSYVWLLDEDAGLATLDLARMLALVRESHANIATPAFVNSGFTGHEAVVASLARTPSRMGVEATGGMACQTGEPMCELQMPHRDCRYRYTNFVEVSFPLITPAALHQILVTCRSCLPVPDSTWGLNRVWCAIAAGKDPDSSKRSCAIIDETPIFHHNFHTHPKVGYRQRNYRARMANWEAMNRVQAEFPTSFVKAEDYTTHQCIAR